MGLVSGGLKLYFLFIGRWACDWGGVEVGGL